MALLRGAALGVRLAAELTRGIAALQPWQLAGVAQQHQQPPWAQQPWRQQQQAGFAAEAAAAPPPPPPPDVYVRLPQPISEPYAVPHKRVFAVVEVGGTQYKVAPNDVIVTEKLAGVDVNDRLQLRRVLLLGSAAETVIGRPYVPEATVTATVEEQFLDGKVLIFHKRRRKNSRRLRGHRQPLTALRILDVLGIAEPPEPPVAATAGAV